MDAGCSLPPRRSSGPGRRLLLLGSASCKGSASDSLRPQARASAGSCASASTRRVRSALLSLSTPLCSSQASLPGRRLSPWTSLNARPARARTWNLSATTRAYGSTSSTACRYASARSIATAVTLFLSACLSSILTVSTCRSPGTTATACPLSRSHIPVHIRPGLLTQKPSRPSNRCGRLGAETTAWASSQLRSTSPSLTPSLRATARTVAS